MASWIKREHIKADIDRYGHGLIPWWTRKGEATVSVGLAYGAIQNWRSSHAMPLLVFRDTLSKRARKCDPNVVIAQRLKRFSSIMSKLGREKNMKLSQMHDLGGCRAILGDITQLDELFERYRIASNDFSATESGMKCYNYLEHPKTDGYRGIHLVGRYKARITKNEHWNGHRIEIQIRTKLQHAFSTAVETVTTFTRSPLKFGGGPDDWRRFFSLVGSAFALREGKPMVPGTPESATELRRELREATAQLNVRQRLRGWSETLKTLPRTQSNQTRWILLVLDVSNDTVQTTGFSDQKQAAKAVAEIEQSDRSHELDAVLVGVNSMKSLRAAYPNYYADTASFVDALDMALR